MDPTDGPLTHQYLAGFTGGDATFQHWTGRLRFTLGAKCLAERGGAWWLVDAIASHQPAARKAGGFQLWTLAVASDHSALLECRADTGLPAVVRQEIEF